MLAYRRRLRHSSKRLLGVLIESRSGVGSAGCMPPAVGSDRVSTIVAVPTHREGDSVRTARVSARMFTVGGRLSNISRV